LGIALAAVVVMPVEQAQMGQSQGTGMAKGQGTTQGMAPPPAQTAAPTQTPPPAVDPAEEAACKKAMSKSTDAKQVIADSNEYLKKYATGRCAGRVHSQLAMANLQQGDGDKAGAEAQKALAADPNDPNALPVMAIVSAHQITGGPGSAPKIKQAEDYANQGINVLNALTNSSPDISEADFTTQRDAKLAMCHSALGLAYLFEQKGPLAVQHLTMATKLENPSEPMDMYLLAVAFDATNQFSQAVTEFEAACPKLPTEMQQRCSGLLAEDRKKASAAHQ
jgi:Tfp pilus assembly protein PilF